MTLVKELDRKVSAEIGAFIQSVAGLEVDAADVLHLSLELLSKNGKELSPTYPLNVSYKLSALSKLIDALQLRDVKDLTVLDNAATEAVLHLRNCLAHAKIVTVEGSVETYSLSVVKISLPEKISDGSGQQEVYRESITIESENIRDSFHEVLKMTSEIGQIRDAVFQKFQGWPNYLYLAQPGFFNSSDILEGH